MKIGDIVRVTDEGSKYFWKKGKVTGKGVDTIEVCFTVITKPILVNFNHKSLDIIKAHI